MNTLDIPDLDVATASLNSIVKAASSLHDKFDLSGIGYGRLHHPKLRNTVVEEPFDYYFFLAGFVHLINAKKIVEVGTHWGGSTRAMARGFRSLKDSKIVTFDITNFGIDKLQGEPNIRPYMVDANTEKAVKIVMEEFGRSSIDLAYIDTAHQFWPTIQSFALMGAIFRPRFVILDDIMLNDSMKECWSALVDLYGKDRAIDCVQVVPAIRRSGSAPGFGLVRMF